MLQEQLLHHLLAKRARLRRDSASVSLQNSCSQPVELEELGDVPWYYRGRFCGVLVEIHPPAVHDVFDAGK